MRALQRASAALIVLTVAGGLTACGDDADASAFCDGVVEFTGAVTNLDVSEESTEKEVKAAGEALGTTFKPVLANVPEDLKSDAEKLDGVITSLTAGDAAPLNEDSTFETYSSLVDGAVGECDYPGADVTAKDYAFEAPDTVKAGSVAFSFENISDGEEHEMIILRKQDGVDLSWDELLDLPEEEARSKTEFVAAAFAPPGESNSALASLAAGDYAMVCFIPVGGEEEGPPHFTQGMIHEFTVE